MKKRNFGHFIKFWPKLTITSPTSVFVGIPRTAPSAVQAVFASAQFDSVSIILKQSFTPSYDQPVSQLFAPRAKKLKKNLDMFQKF